MASQENKEVKLHPLRVEWCFWYLKRQQGTQRTNDPEGYEKGIKLVGTFNTAEDFWAHYNHVARPEDIPFACDLQLFRSNVRPLWEDEENKYGGKFIVTVPRGKRTTSKYWEELLLAVVGSQFGVPDDEVCGVVISTRYHKDILALWTKHADDEELKEKVRAGLKKALGLPSNYDVEYRAHNQAIQEAARQFPKPWESK
eukprot:TRINITY_DN4166_c0_g1_i2.p1 TRINITY_DN4166_c0_g1~~TRINITY_DN4166_c0_g1_i2.p1  ORF type:complete len:199 (-),score=35.73 TRINITY_DN4166_c0_g1_i2:24-620(-)